MWTWEETVNIVHHHLWERRGAKWTARCQRRLAGWRDRAKDGRPAHHSQARTSKEERMTEAVETHTVAPAAKGRLLLASVDAETAQALRAAITEELLTVVRDEAVFQARQELTEDFERVQERWLDDLDRQRREIERDTNARFESEVEAALADERLEWQDQRDSLRTKARTALARAQAAEACVVQLITELVGGVDQRETYLYSGGYGLRTIHKGVINRILAAGGVQLKSRATVSERQVAVTLDDGQTVSHSLFWLVKTTPAGVVDEDAAAEEG